MLITSLLTFFITLACCDRESWVETQYLGDDKGLAEAVDFSRQVRYLKPRFTAEDLADDGVVFNNGDGFTSTVDPRFVRYVSFDGGKVWHMAELKDCCSYEDYDYSFRLGQKVDSDDIDYALARHRMFSQFNETVGDDEEAAQFVEDVETILRHDVEEIQVDGDS